MFFFKLLSNIGQITIICTNLYTIQWCMCKHEIIIPYSSQILTIHYLWPDSSCNRWNDFNRGITYLSDTHWLNCVQLRNVYIASWFDQKWKAIFKNTDKLWNNNHWFCIKTIPNKIVHYSAIFTANMSKIIFKLFELFTIKSVKCTS